MTIFPVRSAATTLLAILVTSAAAEASDSPPPAENVVAVPATAANAAPTAKIPQRIVALTCGGVDIITMLGELPRIIAVEEDCPAPGTEKMAKIRNEDHPGQVEVVAVESIIALDPDLVIAKSDLRDTLGDRGLTMLWSPPVVSMETLPAFVTAIAAALGLPERGKTLLADMDARVAALRQQVAGAKPVRVYYEVNGAGRTAGTSTIPDAMIRLAGGASVAGDDPRPAISLSPEAVVAADPEVIILGPFAESVDAVENRPGWEQIAAIRNHRVFKIPIDHRYVVLGTPRCVQGCAEMFLPWIHPELRLPATATGAAVK